MYLTIKNLFTNILSQINFWNKLKFLNLFTQKFFNKKVSNPNVQFEIIKFNNNEIALSSSPGDIWSFLEIFDLQEYKTIFKLIHKEKIKPFTLIDLGANIGLTYLYFKNLNLLKKYIAVEPLEKNIKLLHFNTFSKNSLILQKAVWTHNKGVKFTNIKENNSNYVSSKGSLDVETITLEEIFQNLLSEDIFLKMDIEGAEYEILKKDLNLISEKAKYLAIEFHNIKKNSDYEKLVKGFSKQFSIIEIKKEEEDYSLVFGLNTNL